VRTGDDRSGKNKVNIAIINNGFLGMVRQWQEFFLRQALRSHSAVAPDLAALANAFGKSAANALFARRRHVNHPRCPRLQGIRAHRFPRRAGDSVYPMVPAGASLHEMIRRPHNPLVETAAEP